MIRAVLRSVIHNATVTHSDPSWPVSLRIDPVILRAAGIIPLELVQLVDVTTGHRYQTWAEAAAENSGIVQVHSPSQAPIAAGAIVTVLAFGFPHEGQTLDHRARSVTLDAQNRPVAVGEI